MKTRSQSCGETVDDDFPRSAAWLAGLKNEVRLGHVLWGRTGTVLCTVYYAKLVRQVELLRWAPCEADS